VAPLRQEPSRLYLACRDSLRLFTTQAGDMNFFVYFVQEVKASRSAPVKVGVTSNIKRRIKTMQTGNPRELTCRVLLGPMTKEAAFEYEGQLHGTFKRMRLRGEWFSGKLLSRISQLKSRSVA